VCTDIAYCVCGLNLYLRLHTIIALTITTLFLDPDSVFSFYVQATYRTNAVNISWTPPDAGMVDNYIITFITARNNMLRTSETSNLTLTANLEYGEKYRIEIISVFRDLNSSIDFATTIIGNRILFYCEKRMKMSDKFSNVNVFCSIWF